MPLTVSLPVYFHPTLTVLVDDSASFLKSLAFQFDPMLACLSFHDTAAALQWLRHSAQRPELPLQANYDTHNPPDQCNVAFDVQRIYRIAEQRERFAAPSVLVVDYSMPQMSGVEFCQAVAHLPCKKILFTGAADEKVAVGAFNRGLIDRYIKKGDEHALDMLEIEIAALQRAYFDSQSETLRELARRHQYGFLDDPVLAELVRQLSRRHGFIEHYLFANPGGLLLLDRNGKATLMMIETEAGMTAQLEIARDSDAPPSLLAALRERRVLAFFSDEGGDGMYTRQAGAHWHRYCAAAQLCQGKERYYWALFDVPPHYFAAPPHSYGQYLRERQQPAPACVPA